MGAAEVLKKSTNPDCTVSNAFVDYDARAVSQRTRTEVEEGQTEKFEHEEEKNRGSRHNEGSDELSHDDLEVRKWKEGDGVLIRKLTRA